MKLIRLDRETVINLEKIASIGFSFDADDNIKATLKYLCSEPSAGFLTEVILGDAAARLFHMIPMAGDPNSPLAIYQNESGELEERPMDPIDRERKLAFQPEFARTKGWYHYKQRLPTTSFLDDGPNEEHRFFIAFVNAKGSCSMRTFDADTGRFIAKTYRAGNYQVAFEDIIRDASELSINSQPNLERHCKERLPEAVLAYLEKQVEEKVAKQQ